MDLGFQIQGLLQEEENFSPSVRFEFLFNLGVCQGISNLLVILYFYFMASESPRSFQLYDDSKAFSQTAFGFRTLMNDNTDLKNLRTYPRRFYYDSITMLNVS